MTRSQQNVLRGIFFMCLAVALMPVMNAIAKVLGAQYPLSQVVWARFAFHFAFMALLFWPRRRWRLLHTRQPLIQFGRSAIMFLSNWLFIAALTTVALATASAIMFTAPLIVTALSVPFLGERVGPRRWAAVAVGFIGALIVIRPGGEGLDSGQLLALGSATCFGLYQILTRKVAALDPPETQILYTALIAAIVMSVIVPFEFTMPRVPLHWVMFAALGMIGGVTQYFVVRALQCAPAATVSPYLYGELIGATILGYALFGDFPDGWTWVGAAIIVASGLYVAYREGLRRVLA
jgi:drug/metabolite transporter (DMT)-like permease